jgi:hypothetical protein
MNKTIYTINRYTNETIHDADITDNDSRTLKQIIELEQQNIKHYDYIEIIAGLENEFVGDIVALLENK